MTVTPVWMDSDTGVDDAIAILSAVQMSNIDLKGITAVAGNVGIEDTFRNTRNVLSLAGREDIKVYKGSNRPMSKILEPAYEVHGRNGIGNAEIVESVAPIETEDGIEAMYNAILNIEGLEIVATGPLTDIGLLIKRHPDTKDKLKRILLMGGSLEGGNATEHAEFNIYDDPEAADIVFSSGIEIVMCGLDVTLKGYLDEMDVERIVSINSPVSRFINDAIKIHMELYRKNTGIKMLCIHDVYPLLFIEHREIFKSFRCGIKVETKDIEKEGKTISDIKMDEKFPCENVELVYDVDKDMFKEIIYALIKKYI